MFYSYFFDISVKYDYNIYNYLIHNLNNEDNFNFINKNVMLFFFTFNKIRQLYILIFIVCRN